MTARDLCIASGCKKKRTNRGLYKNVNILRLSHLSLLQWSAEDVLGPMQYPNFGLYLLLRLCWPREAFH